MLMTDVAEFPHTSTTGKRYRLEERDGRTARIYESGTVIDHHNGQLIEGPEASRLTPDRAIELNQVKANMAVQRARDFVMREIQAISPDDIEDFNAAWGALMGRIGSEAFLSDATLQSRVKAAELVGKATEALPDRRLIREEVGSGAMDPRYIEVLGVLATAIKSVLEDKIGNDNLTNQHETTVLNGNSEDGGGAAGAGRGDQGPAGEVLDV